MAKRAPSKPETNERRAIRRAIDALRNKDGDDEYAYIEANDRALDILSDALDGGDGRGEPSLVVDLSLPPRELCGNGRATGVARTELVRAYREEGRLVGTNEHRAELRGARIESPLYPVGRVAIVVEVRRDPLWSRTKLDDANLQHGLKAAIDGLQDAMIVANDRQFYFDGEVVWKSAKILRGGVRLSLFPEHYPKKEEL